jgi:hypothetical protein
MFLVLPSSLPVDRRGILLVTTLLLGVADEGVELNFLGMVALAGVDELI